MGHRILTASSLDTPEYKITARTETLLKLLKNEAKINSKSVPDTVLSAKDVKRTRGTRARVYAHDLGCEM